MKSGIFERPGFASLVSHELYAHAALDEDMVTERDLKSLSFNLLVAGELEIVSDSKIKIKEKETRLELLKKLAYKKEHLSMEEIVNQYANFVWKVEKGKFKWGSKSDLRAFEQQLIYAISIESKKQDSKFKNKMKFDDRKKYCLDHNRGTCKFEKAHEGKINRQQVLKCIYAEGALLVTTQKQLILKKIALQESD